jgi:hypothetical protein
VSGGPDGAGGAAPGAALARFAERRGQRVFEAAGAFWTPFSGRFHASVPYQRAIDPDPDALAAALRANRVVGARWPAARAAGWPTGLYVCRTRAFSPKRVHPNRQRQVRRGLERCEVRRLDPDELLALGLPLNLDTMRRQRRFDPELGEPARWRRFVAAVRDTPEVACAGAFHGGRLSSYDVFCRDGAWIHALVKMSRTEDLPHYANIALDHWLLTTAAADPGVEAVCNGFTALFDGDTLDVVKTELGYERAPCRLGVQLHPALAPLLSRRWAAGAAGAAARLRGTDRRLQAGAALLGAASLTAHAGGGA